MGSEPTSRTQALRQSQTSREALSSRVSQGSRLGWLTLAMASMVSCALYLLFSLSPLTFAAQETPPAQTMESASARAQAMAPAPAREQRLSTLSSEDVGEVSPPPPVPPHVPPGESTSSSPMADPISDPVSDPVADRVADPVSDPVADRVADSVTPVVAPVIAPVVVPEATNSTQAAATPPPASPAPAATSTSTSTAPPKETRRLFGTVEMRASIRDLRQWQDVQKRHTKNSIFTAGEKLNTSTTWDKLKSMLDSKSPLEKIRGVNSFWNQWPYKLDQAIYGKEDYWAAPFEFRKNSGDCEDYAIAKYYTLKELGFSVEQMRIVVLKDTILNVAHAILAVYLDDDIYILDNIAKNVLSHTRIRNYLPVYSVNEQYRWVHVRTK